MPFHGFAGRIGVVIETTPGHFVSVVMRGTMANIEREADDVTDFFQDSFRRSVPSSRVRIEMEGYLTDERETTAEDATWVTEAAAELPAPTRELGR